MPTSSDGHNRTNTSPTIPLTTSQRAVLRSIGQKQQDDCRLGKAGLSEGYLAFVNELFSRKELVKLRFEDIQGPQRKELAAEIAEVFGAACVAVTGRTVLLYRPNPELPTSKRLLPG